MMSQEPLPFTEPPAPIFVKLFAPGIPAPQGSKVFMGKSRPPIESCKRLAPFRSVVTMAGMEAMNGKSPFGGPVDICIAFIFPRLKSHYGSGRNAGRMRDSAPRLPVSHGLGDIDKLCRAILDALTGVVFADDCQVAAIRAVKAYGTTPGAHVTVVPMGGAV